MNAQYRTILKCKRQLTALLAHELSSIADELLADGFISPSVSKKMRTPGMDGESKASELMDNVAEQIKLNPGRFKEFVDILRTGLHREGLVDLLENTLKDYKDKQQAGRSASLSDDYMSLEGDGSPGHGRPRSYSISSLPPRHISTSSSASSRSRGIGDDVFRDHPAANSAGRTNQGMSSVYQELSVPDLRDYLSSLPAHAQPHLDKQLDWDHEGVDTDLNEIADHMLDWESIPLQLTDVDISDTKDKYPNNPKLQRREALRTWQAKYGLRATYRNLLGVFVKAGKTKCADVLCEVLRKKNNYEQTINYPSRPKRPRLSVSFSSASSAGEFYGEDVVRDHPHHLGPRRTSETNQGPSGAYQGPSSADGGAKVELDLSTALDVIKEVTDWRSLGTHLGVKSSKLDEIARRREDLKSNLVIAWFECDEAPSLDKLYAALTKPSVGATRVAEKVDHMRRVSITSGTTFCGASVCKDSPLENDKRADLMDFTEANVLDAIVKVSNHPNLALKLGIAPHKWAEIEQHPVEDRKQLLVSAFFQTVPRENRNWEWVNKAIKEVEIANWAMARQNSMTQSVSLDNGSLISSVSIDSQEEPSLANKMKEASKCDIGIVHSRLMNAIRKKLKEVEPDMTDFYTHIVSIFRPEDISGLIPDSPDLKDIDGIFKILTKKHMWGFRDISKLKSIAKMFISDDKTIQEMISDYGPKLKGYNANTKIIDRIQSDEFKELDSVEDSEDTSVRANVEKYTREYRKKLTVQLFGNKNSAVLSMKSLEFIEEIWKNLCDEIGLSLTSVLDSIVLHCIEISWFIPSESAQKILERINEAVGFFQRTCISNVFLEGDIIYSESCGVVGAKTLEELKLLLAVQDRSTERTLSLLQSFPGNINMQIATKNDMTLLMIAAHGGCTDLASALVRHGTEVDLQDMDGWSALFYATHQGHLDMINCLLEHGASMTLPDTNGSTVLDMAQKHGDTPDVYNTLKNKLGHQLVKSAKEGNLEAVERILQMGADVDVLDPEKELWTPLMWASWRGHLAVVRHLLQHNPNVNAAAKAGWTPLILSSREGHVEVMKALLDRGAHVDTKTEGGWSSLMMAADFGRTEAGKVLLERGAKIDCVDKKLYTPLAEACQNGHHDFVNMLIDFKPDLNLNIGAGGSWTPLMLACRGGHVKTVEVLIERGASINKAKDDAVTAFHIAASEGRTEIVEYMVNNNVDVDRVDINGITALLHATKDGHLDVIKTILSSGRANLNYQERKGKYSAPFFAVECNKNEILDYFMSNENIDLNITDHNGNTLLDLAEQKNEQAHQLIKDRYPDKMHQMIMYKRHLTAISRGQQPKLTAKKAQELIDSMLHEMDISMGRKVIAASAA